MSRGSRWIPHEGLVHGAQSVPTHRYTQYFEAVYRNQPNGIDGVLTMCGRVGPILQFYTNSLNHSLFSKISDRSDKCKYLVKCSTFLSEFCILDFERNMGQLDQALTFIGSS